jgi:dihydrofolate reductase
MRRVVWAEYVSIDGVVHEPSWTAPFWNDELAKLQKEQLFRSDALLLGRVTYEAFAKAWPGRTDDDGGFTTRMNTLPKHVASRTLKTADWNATIIEGNVGEAVSNLKRTSGGDLLIYGSAGLVETLARHDLIDEYRLMVHPVVVGKGRHAFREGVTDKTFRLIEAKSLSSGVIVLLYEPAR